MMQSKRKAARESCRLLAAGNQHGRPLIIWSLINKTIRPLYSQEPAANSQKPELKSIG
jgi:hypothetical protein